LSLESIFSALDRLHASTYGAATGALTQAANDLRTAPLALVLAFALGMVHALMPGHGKTVLFTYFLGNGARLATGVGMALKIAALHVGTAVVLLLVIGTAVVRFGRMHGSGRMLELASYAAIALIGAWLFYRAASRPATNEDDGHRHRRSGMLAYAVGLLPCPLTIILMNYALVNESVLGGLLLVTVMAAGIAVTMSLTGMTAILARRILTAGFAQATCWFQRGTRMLELAAALAIFLIGIASLARTA
jgi:ABC-type nickel/cobalt efflux system permease component RcnA